MEEVCICQDTIILKTLRISFLKIIELYIQEEEFNLVISRIKMSKNRRKINIFYRISFLRIIQLENKEVGCKCNVFKNILLNKILFVDFLKWKKWFSQTIRLDKREVLFIWKIINAIRFFNL
jgi:hypothetical protein